MNNETLTAVIITRNEERRIASCIRALSFADRIIVVDNNSADNTAVLARKLGADVITADNRDFAALRNLALGRIADGWVLYVDADETVTPDLATEIRRVTGGAGNAAAYELYRKNYYLGHSWPGAERMLRLFRRDTIVTWKGKVHETPEVRGRVGVLSGSLLHDTHRTLTEMTEKTNEWSEVEAKLRFSAGHPPVSWWRILRVMITGFSESFFMKGGWRAGTVGWIESTYQAFSYFVTYAKLWELQDART